MTQQQEEDKIVIQVQGKSLEISRVDAQNLSEELARNGIRPIVNAKRYTMSELIERLYYLQQKMKFEQQ